MQPRILEPEVMDTVEEARDYDAMDHSEVNRVFVEDFLGHWDGAEPVLDVGTGTAQIPLELCKQRGPTSVLAIDLAKEMLKVGEENVRAVGMESSITLRLCDAKAMPFEDGSFGAVMSNSIVHHIPDPGTVLGEMVRVVKPGGLLFVRDLLRPEDLPETDRLVQLYADEATPHQRKMFRESLHAALTVEEMQALVADHGFDPQTVRQTTDRHWTWIARREG